MLTQQNKPAMCTTNKLHVLPRGKDLYQRLLKPCTVQALLLGDVQLGTLGTIVCMQSHGHSGVDYASCLPTCFGKGAGANDEVGAGTTDEPQYVVCRLQVMPEAHVLVVEDII